MLHILSSSHLIRPFCHKITFVLIFDFYPIGIYVFEGQGGRLVSFVSHCLSDTELGYSETDPEDLNIYLALKRLQNYLFGIPSQIIFDHESLKLILILPNSLPSASTAVTEKGSIVLSTYNCKIMH